MLVFHHVWRCISDVSIWVSRVVWLHRLEDFGKPRAMLLVAWHPHPQKIVSSLLSALGFELHWCTPGTTETIQGLFPYHASVCLKFGKCVKFVVFTTNTATREYSNLRTREWISGIDFGTDQDCAGHTQRWVMALPMIKTRLKQTVKISIDGLNPEPLHSMVGVWKWKRKSKSDHKYHKHVCEKERTRAESMNQVLLKGSRLAQIALRTFPQGRPWGFWH